MTQCPEIVQQATEGGFPWLILIAVIVIVGGVYVYQHGIVGTEASLKSLLDKLLAKAEKIEAKIKAKQAAKAMAPAGTVILPTPAKTKAQRIADADALLAAGTITQPIHDAAVAQIAAE